MIPTKPELQKPSVWYCRPERQTRRPCHPRTDRQRSLVDLSFQAGRDTSAEEINALMKAASEEGRLKGVLGYNTLPLVSMDFNHTTQASTFDSTLTKVTAGKMVKVFAWYDNEWGFSCQMLNTARRMFGLEVRPF